MRYIGSNSYRGSLAGSHMREIRIDISEIVGEIFGVISHPYKLFIERLHAEGRISDEEVAGLRQDILDRIPRLNELVAERFGQGPQT